MNQPRPDILFLMLDQMRGDCLSALEHPVVRTPHLDQLASEGTLFRRAYTTVSSCIPARYALLTGLFPQTSGVVGFAAKPFATPPLPQLLAEAGYATVLVGRTMHQLPESGSCGYQQQFLGSTYIADDDYDQFLCQAAPETGGIRKLIHELGVSLNHWQANSWPLPEELHPTDWVVARSHDVVEEASPDQPLFLTTSFFAPHPPLFPPKRYFDAYYNADLPAPAMGDWVDQTALSPEGDEVGHRILLQGEILRRSQAGYFGLIEQIDEQVGPLIRAFQARSERAGRPWVVMLTSDHGEMLGDHGYFRKCEPYEGSGNIPFIISGSAELGLARGERVEEVVCLEDIMPTFLELAGASIPGYLDGVSLVPTLRGSEQNIRDSLHFEHATCYSQEQAYHALTDGQHKYIWRPHDGSEQLFDLKDDPCEERNLAMDTGRRAMLEVWRQRLVLRLADRPEGFVEDGRLVAGRPYPALNSAKLCVG